MSAVTARDNIWLRRFAVFLAAATFLLIVAGALVTSNDAGLSVPDWPTSFGSFRMPAMVGGVKYEHGHRMIAGVVGLLTIGFAITLAFREPRRWVRWLGGIAVATVLTQAVLGGITVLFYLPVLISVGHATLAQIFFCLTVSLALFTGREWRWDDAKLEDSATPSLRLLSAVTTATVLLQLVLGAAFRHSGLPGRQAGLGLTPHLVGAAVVTALVVWVAARVLTNFAQEARLRRAALWLASLLMVQLGLGAGSYALKLQFRDVPQPLPPVVAVTTAHVAIGALVLAASLVLTHQAFRRLATPQREFSHVSASEGAA